MGLGEARGEGGAVELADWVRILLLALAAEGNQLLHLKLGHHLYPWIGLSWNGVPRETMGYHVEVGGGNGRYWAQKTMVG